MGILQGLVKVNEELAKRGSGDYEDRPKANWASIKPNGGPLKLVFLQELDEGSPNYSKKNGLAVFSTEHQNPDNFKKRAACTADEGECFGCQRGWRQKVSLYANVLVDNGKDEPFVAIWSRALGKGSVAQDLLNMASDEDFDHSITDKVFKFTRTGTTKDDTTYSLSPMPKAHDKNVEDYELYDLKQYIFTVAPERQEEYYLGKKEERAEEPVSSGSGSIEADW